MNGGVKMTVEELKIEMDLKLQVLEDKIDDYIASNGHSGVYTDETPDYVKAYIKSRKLEGGSK